MDAYNFICKIPEDKRSLFCPILDYKLIKNVSVLGTRINYTIYAVLPKKGGRGGGARMTNCMISADFLEHPSWISSVDVALPTNIFLLFFL